MGDLGLIPGLGRSPGEGKGYPLQYSGLENSMDCIGCEVTKSWSRFSDFLFHFSLSLETNDIWNSEDFRGGTVRSKETCAGSWGCESMGSGVVMIKHTILLSVSPSGPHGLSLWPAGSRLCGAPLGRLPGPGLAGQMDSKQLVIKWVNEQ